MNVARPALLDWALRGRQLIEASAGTGKTWTICALYLRLLLERGLEVTQILVVTFTNAASAELRERIRTRLAQALEVLEADEADAVPADPLLTALIAAAIERSGRQRDDLRRSLRLALATFDEAAIFTIHSFCKRVLDDTPFAAALPLQIELVGDDSDLVLEAAQDAWRRHVVAGTLSTPLVRLLLAQRDAPQSLARSIAHRLGKPLAREIWFEGPAPDSAAFAELEASWRCACAAWQREAAAIEACVRAAVAAKQLNGNKTQSTAIDKAVAAWQALAAGDDALLEVDEKFEIFTTHGLQDRVNKNQQAPEHEFFALAGDYLDRRRAVMLALACERSALLRRMQEEAIAQVGATKQARRQQSFNDLLFSLNAQLASAPGLAAVLRQRYPVALIDEFQDTDPLQFDTFSRIYPAAEDTLFLVGDPKQAIYSFRQADLHTYLAARNSVVATHSLADNQRSSASLIAALNAVFGAHPAVFMIDGLDYHRVGVGSKQRASFSDSRGELPGLHLWWLPDSDAMPLSKRDAQRVVATACADEIARLLRAGLDGAMQIDQRGLVASDIAVLVRSHQQGRWIKQALAAVGVGAVELGQDSVFHAPEAEELERVLQAVLAPSSERRLRAALATSLLGLDAHALLALNDGDAELMRWFERFARLAERWQRHGFARMFRELLRDMAVMARLLAMPEGERRLTNLLHLGECLQQTAESLRTPEALLHFLHTQRRRPKASEDAQLRLESDDNLVRIVTIHKSKGLEYPVVFCPYLWDAKLFLPDDYHDAAGEPVIDYRGKLLAKEAQEEVAALRRAEAATETLRLIYVALTRAVFRCYLPVGSYSSKDSASAGARSLLNWMVLGAGKTPEEWFKAKLSRSEVIGAWQALAAAHPDAIACAPLPLPATTPVALPRPPADDLRALALRHGLPSGWRIGSYSSLMHGAGSERAASDHDAQLPVGAVEGDDELSLSGDASVASAADDILHFPRGAEAGECIHAVFERIDFTDAASWPAAIATALQRFPLRDAANARDALQRVALPALLQRMLREVLATELEPGLRLDRIASGHRLTELEFALPTPQLDAAALNDWLAHAGYPMPPLRFDGLRGYLKGFIDLVFRHQGRYYVLDWKSNHLGMRAADYEQPGLAAAMQAHGYHLQYLLYTVALHRYLRQRIAGYRYDEHIGGVFYLFVRGVRPDWRDAGGTARGVYAHKPPCALIEQLDALLGAQQEDR